jgi:hypothetical protein
MFLWKNDFLFYSERSAECLEAGIKQKLWVSRRVPEHVYGEDGVK